MLKGLASVSRAVSRASLLFAGFGLVVMTGIIGWQVFARYVLGDSLAWSEQAGLVLMVYYILLAAAVGVREGFHIRLSAVADAAPPAVRRWMSLAAHAVVLAFGLAMGWVGIDLCLKTWAHDIPTLGLPRGVAYLPLPAAGWLIALFSLEQLIATWRGERIEPLWN